MSKRKYTKIQMLLPVIEGMIAEGMSHREIEKELGLEGDRPIHNLLKRQRRKATNEKLKYRGRKPAKTLQEYKYENKRLKWKWICCGIFCAWEEGSEATSKISGYSHESRALLCAYHVPVFRRFTQRILRLSQTA